MSTPDEYRAQSHDKAAAAGASQQARQGGLQPGGPAPFQTPTGYGEPTSYGQAMSYDQPGMYAAPAGYGMPPAPGAEPPLHLPLYGANLKQAVVRYFKNYAVFSGRASRSEYWLAYLAGWLAALFLIVLFYGSMFVLIPPGTSTTVLPWPLVAILILGLLLWLGTIVPNLSLIWRRLHDANFSGAMFFLQCLPFGGIIVFILTLYPADPQGVRFDEGFAGYAMVPAGQAPYGWDQGQK